MDNSDLYLPASPRLPASGTAEFASASAEELRVLIAVCDLREGNPTAEAIEKAAKVSKARCAAALALWCEAGVIECTADARDPLKDALTIEKFGSAADLSDEPIEENATRVADMIRDEGLSDMIAAVADLLHRPALSTAEIKRIVALRTQFALPDEYIMKLATSLEARGKLTVLRLVSEAQRLVGQGIDSVIGLTFYLDKREKESGAEWDFRHLLGIYDRALTATERKYLTLWSEQYGYGADILGEAFDITVSNTGKLSLSYMNTLLTGWHDAGAKTPEECRRAYEQKSAALAEEFKQKRGGNAKPKKKAELYDNFASDDVFQSILARSFGDGAEESKEDEPCTATKPSQK